MRVTLLSRYPRVDTARWKLDLMSGILEAGHEASVVYTKSALADQVQAGLREFGLGALSRYRRARGQEALGAQSAPTQSISDWAERHDVPVRRHRTIRDPALLEDLRALSPDVLVLAGADIVPELVLDVPGRGAINPHYGLLPEYRGMNVAEWSVFHGDPVGVTVHYVDPGIDTGDILEREPIRVDPGDDLASIRAKQQALARELLLRAVERIAIGDVDAISQRPDEGRQFYRMHPAIRRRVQRSLETGAYPSTAVTAGPR